MTKEFNAQQKKLQEMQRKVSSIYEEKCASEVKVLMSWMYVYHVFIARYMHSSHVPLGCSADGACT